VYWPEYCLRHFGPISHQNHKPDQFIDAFNCGRLPGFTASHTHFHYRPTTIGRLYKIPKMEHQELPRLMSLMLLINLNFTTTKIHLIINQILWFADVAGAAQKYRGQTGQQIPDFSRAASDFVHAIFVELVFLLQALFFYSVEIPLLSTWLVLIPL
jgi:hypothetical protein